MKLTFPQDQGLEEAAVRILQLHIPRGPDFPIILIEVLTVQLPPESIHPGEYSLLSMPYFPSAVCYLPQLEHQAILKGFIGKRQLYLPMTSGGQRIKAAIEYVHNANMVHMDVKSDNILFDTEGRWFLGM